MGFRQNLAVSRYTVLLDETVTHLLVPITDNQDMALVALEESLKSVIHLFDDIERERGVDS